jgi:hypothetical protein
MLLMLPEQGHARKSSQTQVVGSTPVGLGGMMAVSVPIDANNFRA